MYIVVIFVIFEYFISFFWDQFLSFYDCDFIEVLNFFVMQMSLQDSLWYEGDYGGGGFVVRVIMLWGKVFICYINICVQKLGFDLEC